MDPLTHTLVGANLAATGLKEKTRLAGAALVIGANLPDVDAILYFTNTPDLALWCRRGWTHGVLALALLPLLQTALLLGYDRLRPDPSRRADPKWLLLLSSLAILTHPSLDWLNNYGLRWLMPFDGSWFYGDAVYIMDPWLWIILGAGWLAGRRPTRAVTGAFAVCALLVGAVVAGRSTEYLPIVVAVAALLFAVLLWRPGVERATAFANAALVIGALYVGARLVIHDWTERRVRQALSMEGRVSKLMVAPHPLDPLTWDVVAELPGVYRVGRYTWRGSRLQLDPASIPRPAESAEWSAAKADPEVRGFVNWARFPWYEVERTASGTFVRIYDARYMTRRGGRGFGGVAVQVETPR